MLKSRPVPRCSQGCDALVNTLPHFVSLCTVPPLVPKGFGISSTKQQYFSLKLNLSLLVDLSRHVPLPIKTLLQCCGKCAWRSLVKPSCKNFSFSWNRLWNVHHVGSMCCISVCCSGVSLPTCPALNSGTPMILEYDRRCDKWQRPWRGHVSQNGGIPFLEKQVKEKQQVPSTSWHKLKKTKIGTLTRLWRKAAGNCVVFVCLCVLVG